MSAGDVLAMLQGAVVTVTLSLTGILIGLPIGLGLAVLRWADVPVIARIVAIYVSMLRATPLVTLLLLLFFALPNIGIAIGPISAAILALVMNTAAFNCEVWRASLMNFPKDQYEAAQSVGMSAPLRFRRIVLPQIARTSLPGLVNEMSLLIKVTPVLRWSVSSISPGRRCGSAPRPMIRYRHSWSRWRSMRRSCSRLFPCNAG